MEPPQHDPFRVLKPQEQQDLRRVVKATSERVDVVKRARILLAVAAGWSWSEAGRQVGMSRQAVGKVVKRFNARGLAALEIAPGRGRKVTYTSAQRARMLAEVQQVPDRREEGTAPWSLSTLQRALRTAGLPQVGATTIRRVLPAAGYAFGKTRTWCPTGTALRKRKAGIVTVQDPAAPEKTRLIEQAYAQAQAAGLELWNEDEAGPSQAIPQPGQDWHPEGKPRLLPHAYQRGGTAKLLTLFRPASGLVRAKGVLSAPNAVLHPWLVEPGMQEWAEIEKAHPPETLPPEAERPLFARLETWLGHPLRRPLPPLRMILVWDNLARHLTDDLVDWLFDHGILPLYTPLSGSWLNRAEAVQRIIVRRALSGQHPQSAQQVIDWLEQTVTGWNKQPTPFVWNGKRRQPRMRARLRRLGGSGAALLAGNLIAA